MDVEVTASRMWVVTGLLVATAAVVMTEPWTDRVPLGEPLATLPGHLQGWKAGVDTPLDEEVVASLGLDDYLNRTYLGDEFPVQLYVAYYARQQIGRDVHSPAYCLPGAGWEPVERGSIAIAIAADAPPLIVNRYVVEKGLDRLVVLFWYEIQGHSVASEWARKFSVMSAGLLYGRSNTALIRVMSPVINEVSGVTRAERRAVDFVRAVKPVLDMRLAS